MFIAFFTLLLLSSPGIADTHAEKVLRQVAFEQHIGQSLPGELLFTNAEGKAVRLGTIIDKPTVLVLAWYDCPSLCGMILHGLARSLSQIPFEVGDDFEVVTLSIDPDEGPAVARRTREELLTYYGDRDARGWHVLTGEQTAIKALAMAVGFRYVYDAGSDQYAHPAGLILVDGNGRISRYLFGIDFAVQDLRLGLLETSRGELGSPIDRFVLSCYRFDPQSGRYTLEVMHVMRWLGLGTTVLLGGGIGLALRREHRRRKEAKDEIA